MLLIRIIFILMILGFCLNASSQTRADWWYFGNNAGLHFMQNGPVADTNGSLNTAEGCTAISDLNGNLLFYTDGITVYDSTHGIMPNGTNLFGNSSSVQSSVIVPFPDHPLKYYVFTADSPHPTNHKGFRYSIVDLSLNGGLGDVDSNNKNVLLFTPTCEKITAVADAANEGYWVAGYKGGSDSIFTYHLTAFGLEPQVFAGQGSLITNSFNTFDRQTGQMKFSPNGKLLGIVQGWNTNNGFTSFSRIDLLEFDNTNGTCNNLLVIYADSNNGYRYGLEFSSDSKMLYSSARGGGPLLQLNVSSYDSAIIASSLYIVDSNRRGSLQLGPDGKIYLPSIDYVSRINNPQLPGAACNFEANAVYLEGKISVMSITTVVQSLVREKFRFSSTCEGDTVVFQYLNSNADSLIWNFGDTASGINNTASDSIVDHFYNQVGSYYVSLQVWKNGSFYLVTDSVKIYPFQQLNLVNDTTLCEGDTLKIDISRPHASYLWSNANTSPVITITTDTQLAVTVFGYCDTLSDSTTVQFVSVPQVELGNDTTMCNPAILTFDTTDLVYTHLHWSTGDTNYPLALVKSGMYSITLENACGMARDSLFITLDSLPSNLLPDDTIICPDETLILSRPDDAETDYIWHDSSNSINMSIDSTAVVWLEAANHCGNASDTMSIVKMTFPSVSLGADTIVCENESIVLDATTLNAEYNWSNGANTPFIESIDASTIYSVTVTIDGCSKVLNRKVSLSEEACNYCNFVALNVFTPNADGINDVWTPESDCNLAGTSLVVYNRWGVLVFSGNDAVRGWDGSINGNPAAEGVYFYQVYDESGKHLLQGSLTLLRN